MPGQLVSDAVGNARAEQRRLRNALALAGFVSCAGDALGARAGFTISGVLQVFVGKEQISRAFGQTNLKSVSFATGLGAASSSCSYAAVAAARSAMQQGAALIPALAFMFASTNLVIELGAGALGFDGVAVCVRGSLGRANAYPNHVVIDTLVFT